MWNGEADPSTCANCGCHASHDVAVSKARLANAEAGQGDLLMTVPVARRLPLQDSKKFGDGWDIHVIFLSLGFRGMLVFSL